MSHSPARGSSSTSNEPNDGLRVLSGLVVLLQELGSVLLHGASNLADDDDALGPGVIKQDLESVDMGSSGCGRTGDAIWR